MRIISLFSALALSLAPAATRAETIKIPGDLCGKLSIDSAEPLEGKWIAVNRQGGGSVGSRIVAMDDRPKEKLTLEYAGNGILIFRGKNDLGDQRLDMKPQTVPEDLPSTFNVQNGKGKIITVDISELLPCVWGRMPGYKGHIDYPLPGVGEMRMTVMLNFPSEQMGFGALHFTGSMQGQEIDVWRYVTLTRKE
ncbi:MAG: hypothetical protein H6917_14565 [Novosphingobium sp.]|nr:hypothetical protein [Novosphingobium sp.]MCP5403591.1 hypothetical protein [Novosphingobium sp.]